MTTKPNMSMLLFLSSRQVMSDSLRLHGLWPTRLLCPWEFSRQECWRGLPFPPPGDLPNPRIELGSLGLQADCLSLSHLGSPIAKVGLAKKFVQFSRRFYGKTQMNSLANPIFCTITKFKNYVSFK